jgi:hypothetical protein
MMCGGEKRPHGNASAHRIVERLLSMTDSQEGLKQQQPLWKVVSWKC